MRIVKSKNLKEQPFIYMLFDGILHYCLKLRRSGFYLTGGGKICSQNLAIKELYIEGACSHTKFPQACAGGSDPKMMEKMLWVGLMALLVISSQGIDVQEIRRLASIHNITCILVFGDSTVDPGNNNRLSTTFKGNFMPYGKDFYHGRPTGRLTNGRLPTDFIGTYVLILRNLS